MLVMNKVKLKNICIEVGKYGIPATAVDFDENLYRYLRITDISDYGYLLENDKKSLNEKDAEKYLLSKNDIVFARTGASTGRSFFYEEKFGKLVYAGFLIKFKLDEKLVNPKFIKYYTISQKYKKWIEYFQDGSTRGNMNANTFANMDIELPNRKQQDLAVSILSSLEDNIELNNKINKELENLARTIYEYWFVQNAEESWERKKIGEIGEFKNGANYEKANTIGENVKIINVRDISSSSIFIDIENLDEIILQKKDIDKYLLNENDIIFARSGIPGAIRLVEKTEENVIFCGFAIRFRLNDKNLKEYAFFSLKQNEEFAKNKSGGSIMPNISQDSLKDTTISFPPIKLLGKFNKIVSPFFEQIIKNRQESTNLAQLRDFLLPLLMNGQVTVNF